MPFLAKIKAAAPGVVKENSVRQSFAQTDKEWNGLVQGIAGFLPRKRVGIPHGESAVATVHGPGFIAQAVVTFFLGHPLPDTHAALVPSHPLGLRSGCPS